MRKLKTERVTGIVALSYLILLPFVAYQTYQKLQSLSKDMDEVWQQLDEYDILLSGDAK